MEQVAKKIKLNDYTLGVINEFSNKTPTEIFNLFKNIVRQKWNTVFLDM